MRLQDASTKNVPARYVAIFATRLVAPILYLTRVNISASYYFNYYSDISFSDILCLLKVLNLGLDKRTFEFSEESKHNINMVIPFKLTIWGQLSV